MDVVQHRSPRKQKSIQTIFTIIDLVCIDQKKKNPDPSYAYPLTFIHFFHLLRSLGDTVNPRFSFSRLTSNLTRSGLHTFVTSAAYAHARL